MLELLVGVLLAAGATYYVLLPILRPSASGEALPESAALYDEGDDPADDMTPQTVALRALKEIEFDRATGKLSDSDYTELKAKYTAEALAALKAEQGAARKEQPMKPAPRPQPTAPTCPTHGKRPERDAVFCSECGRRLGTAAAGYCSRCGTALASDARYCNSCGARVAA